MSMKNQLGQGLEALIPPKSKKTSLQFLNDQGTRRRESVFWVEVEKIEPNPYQPRADFEETALGELADSIREFGILQPLIVSKVEREKSGGGLEAGYQLIAGERRLRAAKIAGFNQVPVIIRKPDEQKKLEFSLVENIQRENLNALERARALEKLIDDFSLTQKEVAARIGKSREFVANTLRLLELPDNIQQLLSGNKLSEGHARTLIGLEREHQQLVITRILEENLNVRAAEELARRLRSPFKNLEREFEKDVLALQEIFTKTFPDLQIRITRIGSREQLTFRFSRKGSLREFLKRLTKTPVS